MDKLSEHAIRMLEIEDANDISVIGNRQLRDIARAVYDTILQVQMLKMTDRKTEQTHDIHTETHECVKDTHDKTEPTISKCEWPIGSPQCEGCDRLPPQTKQSDSEYYLELADAVMRGEMSDASANQAWYEYINKKYIIPQTDCAWGKGEDEPRTVLLYPITKGEE